MDGLSNGKLTFSAWDVSESFTIETDDDTDADDETVDLGFGTLPDGVDEDDDEEYTSVTLTIRDGDRKVRFSSSSYTVDEGESETIRVRLTGARNGKVVIPITVAESDDYEVKGLSNGNLTFSAWDTSESFTIETDDDTDYEGDETVNIGFGDLPSSVSGAGSPSSATLTIEDDDPPPNNAPTLRGPDRKNYAENGKDSVATYTATDPDGDRIRWSLSGDDSGAFGIDSGVLSFNNPPDFEARADSDRNNKYKVTVTARDDNGGSDSITVTITVTNVNEAPVSEPIGARTLDEGDSSLQIDLASYFSDPDADDTLRYTVSASQTGVVTLIVNGSDLTVNRSASGSTDVTVKATDGGGLNTSRGFSVTVVNAPPTFDDGDSVTITVPEGASGDIGDPVSATDIDIGDTLTYSLGGTDAASFSIDDSDGQLRTNAALDFETKNSYSVIVIVSDGKDDQGKTELVPTTDASIAITINVTNVEEPGVITLSTTTPTTGAEITATLSDEDGNVRNESWQWRRLPNLVRAIIIIPGATGHAYTPVIADTGSRLSVTVTYDDEHGTKKKATSAATKAVALANSPPTFKEAATPTPTRTVPENTGGGMDIGKPVSADDPDNDTLTYSLSGTDASAFQIVAASGQLQTKTGITYDHEATRNTYSVTVNVTDSKDDQGKTELIPTTDNSIAVTINVTNVNEAPVVASQIADRTLTVGDTASIYLTSRFRDPDGDALIHTARSSDTGVATASVSGGSMTLAAVSAGAATVRVVAADRHSKHSDRLAASQTFTVTVNPPAPDKVVNLRGAPGSVRGEMTLDWDPASRASVYEVQQWKPRTLFPITYHWVTLDASEATVDSSAASAVVKGLVGGETYRHRVRGLNSDGVGGPWSDHVDTTLTLPAKVVNLSGAPGPVHGEIALAWNSASHATGYEVQQKKPRRGLPDEWIALPADGFEVETVGTTAVVRNLDPDTTYEHQVRGVNVHGEGGWSDSVETAPRDERPATPTGLMGVIMRGGRGISLSWQAVVGAADYEVELSFGTQTTTEPASMASIDLVGMTPEAVYGFRVRSLKSHGSGYLTSGWSGAVSYIAPIPSNIGHQEDHTVEYEIGSITSAPGLPAGVPDPATVISAAIGPAAGAWNTAAMAIAGKNLKICKVMVMGDACDVSNHDMGTVTVKTVSVNTMDVGFPDTNHKHGCGWSVACVKFGPTSASDGPGRHLGDMSLIIEEPAWECRGNTDRATGACIPVEHARIYWTNTSGLDGDPVPGLSSGSPPSYYYYIGATMIHEFGHTLGLPDFYDHPTLMNLPAVMDDPHTNMTITDEDLAQLGAIYAVHDSSDH